MSTRVTVCVCGASALWVLGLATLSIFATLVGNFPGEVAVSTWVQSWRTSWLDTVMRAVSWPGYGATGPAIVGLTVVLLYLKGLRKEGLLLLTLALVSKGINAAFKDIIARPRPSDDLVQVLQTLESYAFPSGHVMSYMVFLGVLAVIANARMKPGLYRTLVQAGLALGMAGVGVSRIYLGTHWVGDVVAGYAVGAALVTVAIVVVNRVRFWERRAGRASSEEPLPR